LAASVFITGGTGFIGGYIIRELVETGYTVRALKRSHSQLPFFIPANLLQQVEWVEGDVLDVVSLAAAMADTDMVIHAAALVSLHKKDRHRMYRVNIDGTANVVNAALESKIRRFVHVSSVAAIGRKKEGGEVNEDQPWEKNSTTTHYGISKYRSELEVWRGMGEGLNAVIVNPSTVIGFGDWNNSSSAIFQSVYDQFPWYTNGVNGFVAVEDVARVTRLLMETAIVDERFIISAENWSFRHLFNTIADGFGKRQPYREATPFLGELAWRLQKFKALFSNKQPLLTKESARVAQSKTYFDNRKILQALGGFSFTALEKTIENACKNYLLAINRGD
jgi:nucleoside-diphosphate-sugar epimerase